MLADDAAVCARAAALVAAGTDAYALTTHPGHHASAEHYGGYCFVNNAVHVARLLTELGRRPYILDVDYHAGDGTAHLLMAETASSASATTIASRFVSLHAPKDYPFMPPGQPWAVDVPPGATWSVYAPLALEALGRRAADTDCIVLSLGFDTLAADPDAREGHRFALAPLDFGRMRSLLREATGGLPLCAVQEGGYHLEDIPAAAEAFWTEAV